MLNKMRIGPMQGMYCCGGSRDDIHSLTYISIQMAGVGNKLKLLVHQVETRIPHD